MWLVKSLLAIYLPAVCLSEGMVHVYPGPTSMTRDESQLKIRWLTEDTLELEEASGSKTKIMLKPASHIEDEPTPCLWTGQLEDDPNSRVTVSGCIGHEETAVTLASSKVEGGVVDLWFTSSATYQLGLLVSADSLSAAEDALQGHSANVRSKRSTSSSDEVSDIKLKWVKDKEEMKITFGNKKEDKILLSKSDKAEEEEEEDKAELGDNCLFTGALESDHDSEVVVDGCMGDDETKVDIDSILVPCGFVNLVLTKDDTYIWKQDDEHMAWHVKNKTDDTMRIEGGPSANAQPWNKPLPEVVTLETRVKYDQGLVEATGGKTEAKRFISRAAEHANTRLHLLPIKVELKIVGKMEYVNAKWSASPHWIRSLRSDSDQVVSHFCAGGAGGIAYLGAVCGGYWGVNINEHIRWPGRAELVTGRTFAHELGHNLGMEHDFAQKHGGNNRPGSGGRCEGKGLMSYGSCNPRCHDSRMPDAWSTCSISDFEALFKQSAHKCLAKKGGATGTGVSGTDEGCKCNRKTHRGYGNCKNRARCGNWCYVDNPEKCSYSYRSYIGAPWRWTCEPCDNTGPSAMQELVAPPCPLKDSATAFSLTLNVLICAVAALLTM